MNKNIDLGTFSWDISKIEQQLIENRKQIEAFSGALATNKKALKDEQKELQQLGSQIATMKALQKDANNQLKAGTLSQEQYNKTMTDSNSVISQNESRIREVISTQSAHIKTILEQERAVKELRLENNELNKMLNAGRTEIVGNEHAYRNLNKELNALKVESKNLGAQLLQLKKEGKENTDEYRNLETQWKKVSEQADALNSEFKALDKAVGDNQRSVGDYTDSIKKAFGDIPGQIASGDIKGAISSTKEGLSGLFNMIKANPILAVVGALALFAKEMWQYNAEVKELNTTVEQLANTSGTATDELRKNATAIQQTYGTDFNDAVKELNSLMTDFGLSAGEAFRIYNEGLAAGGAQNAEFGDSIREYGPLFQQAGYSAEDFVNILNSGIDLGIYNDKLPDAIKEAGLSLKEQTKSTRDALVNAFGATFTDDILKKVRSGQLTVAQALDSIAKKAEGANLNQQQWAQLTADVFKGAGEDAGGALKIFEAINNAQLINYDNLTDLEKATYDVANSNRELAEAKDNAFKSDSMMSFMKTVDEVWRQVKITWYNYLGSIVKNTQKEIDFLKLVFYNVKDAITSIPKAFSLIMNGLNGDFKQLASIASAVGNVFKNMFNPEALAGSISQLMGKVNGFKSLTSAAIGEVSKFSSNINRSNISKVQGQRAASNSAAQAYGAVTNGPVTGSVKDAADKQAAAAKASADKAVRDAQKNANDKQKILEEEAKKAFELLKSQAELRSDIAKNELSEYIAVNAAKLADDKRLTAEKLANEIKYFDDLKALQIANNTSEMEKSLLGKTEAEKEQIRKEYAIKELDITNEINEKKRDVTSAYNEQIAEDEQLARAIEFEQKLIEIQTNGATEYELQRAQADEQQRLNLEALEVQRENELISFENYEAKKRLIETQNAEARKAITEAETQTRLSSYADMFGGVASLLGEQTAAGKAAGIAQATINAYQGVTEVWKTPSVLPEPMATIAKVVNTGVVLASGLGAVKKIAGVKAARGMLISGPSHASGGVPISTPSGMIEAEGGEVIINKRSSSMFRGLLSEINTAGGGIPLFANGGTVPTSVQKQFATNPIDYAALAAAVAEGAAAGTYSGSQSGISDLSENRKISQNANF